MESDHGLEKILGVGLELEFKSMEPDWIWTPKKVTSLISGGVRSGHASHALHIEIEKVDLFFRDHCISRTKSALLRNNFK